MQLEEMRCEFLEWTELTQKEIVTDGRPNES
jgi:hypothetical protein